MNDKEEIKFIFLYLNYILFVFGLIIYAITTNNKLLRINEKLDGLKAEAAALEADIASLTDATTEEVTEEVTEATPTEPSDEEISISVRESTTEQATELQEVSTETLTEELEEIPTEEPEAVPETSESSYGTYLGWYELTAYEWTGSPCANGNYPTAGYTVACNSLALGTRIYIEGYGEYVVEDRGGMAGNVIDIYMGDYNSCIQFGRQGANVYIID